MKIPFSIQNGKRLRMYWNTLKVIKGGFVDGENGKCCTVKHEKIFLTKYSRIPEWPLSVSCHELNKTTFVYILVLQFLHD